MLFISLIYFLQCCCTNMLHDLNEEYSIIKAKADILNAKIALSKKIPATEIEE